MVDFRSVYRFGFHQSCTKLTLTAGNTNTTTPIHTHAPIAYPMQTQRDSCVSRHQAHAKHLLSNGDLFEKLSHCANHCYGNFIASVLSLSLSSHRQMYLNPKQIQFDFLQQPFISRTKRRRRKQQIFFLFE